MARSHEALARSSWNGAGLQELTSTVLSPFVDPAAHELIVRGEDLVLRERAVLPLALSLHELATNSLKHGALGCKGGRIELAWSATDRARLRIEWTESQPGSAPPDSERGLGMRLVEELVQYDLGGQVEVSSHERGLTWMLELPGGEALGLDPVPGRGCRRRGAAAQGP